MKTTGIILVILCCQYKCVLTASFYDVMTKTFSDMAETIDNALTYVMDKFNEFVADVQGGKIGNCRTVKKVKCTKLLNKKTNVKNAVKNESDAKSDIKKLKFEPGASLPTPELANYQGRSIQSHVVKTEDGYLLGVHRITKTQYDTSSENNKTVLLHHGILGSSADWILLGPEKSLPYLLQDQGYDVWLSNARGNIYSSGHVSKSIETLQFWTFTWQDVGLYDLSATVTYIRNYKNMTDPINFVGHSMGATALLVLLSKKPEYASYFKLGILLAPLAYMTKIQGPMLSLAPFAFNPDLRLLNILGTGKFLPSKMVPPYAARRNCQGLPIFCSNPLLYITGSMPKPGDWTDNFKALVLTHVPAGTSTGTILHYGQLIKSGKFHSFGNESDTYNVSNITVPLAMFSSYNDWLAPTYDVLRLYMEVQKPIQHVVFRDQQLNHTDFVWGQNGKSLIFEKVVKIIENGLNYTDETFSIKL